MVNLAKTPQNSNLQWSATFCILCIYTERGKKFARNSTIPKNTHKTFAYCLCPLFLYNHNISEDYKHLGILDAPIVKFLMHIFLPLIN